MLCAFMHIAISCAYVKQTAVKLLFLLVKSHGRVNRDSIMLGDKVLPVFLAVNLWLASDTSNKC